MKTVDFSETIGLNIFIYLNIVQYLQLQHLYVYDDLNGSYKWLREFISLMHGIL